MEEDNVCLREVEDVDVGLDAEAFAYMCSVTVLQGKTRECGDLNCQALVGGVEAVDERRNHDRDLGLLAEFLLSAHDCQVDFAVGSRVREGIDGSAVVVRPDGRTLNVVLVAAVVGEERSARGVDESCWKAFGSPCADTVKNGEHGRKMVRSCCDWNQLLFWKECWE